LAVVCAYSYHLSLKLEADMNESPSKISRRELLKILGASVGSAGASLLVPARWTKPAILAGVLPAHAQSTAVLEIIRGALDCPTTFKANPPTGPSATIYYSDSLGGVDAFTILKITSSGCPGGQIKLGDIASDLFGTWSGNGFSGSINLPLGSDLANLIGCSGAPSMCFELIDGGRESNKFCLDTLCPEQTAEPG
jgi:hypothetical protein